MDNISKIKTEPSSSVADDEVSQNLIGGRKRKSASGCGSPKPSGPGSDAGETPRNKGKKRKIKAEPPVTLKDLVGTRIYPLVSPPDIIKIERGVGTHKFAAMGLETTNFVLRESDILQITCSYVDGQYPDFCRYVISKREINPFAGKQNGFTSEDGVLKENGEEVKVVSLQEALDSFVEYLQRDTILVCHVTSWFHSNLLVRKIEERGMRNAFGEKIVGFSNNYSLFLKLFPKRKDVESVLSSRTLKGVINHFSEEYPKILQDSSTESQNMAKIQQFAKLLRCLRAPLLGEGFSKLYEHSCTFDYTHRHIYFDDSIWPERKSFVDNDVMEETLAKRIANAGLGLRHLQLAFETAGIDGLSELLRPHGVGNKNSQKISQKLSELQENKKLDPL